jgi:hypothetical protein
MPPLRTGVRCAVVWEMPAIKGYGGWQAGGQLFDAHKINNIKQLWRKVARQPAK